MVRLQGADVQVAELRLSPSYCCVQAGETECGTWPRRSCVDFDLIIGEINFFPFPCQQFCSLCT